MAFIFEEIGQSECVLCGANENLTGEHKFKASLLREEFAGEPTYLFGAQRPKLAQSPKSKVFHFHVKLCRSCNSEKTQAGDKAFDKVHAILKQNRAEGRKLVGEGFKPSVEISEEESVDHFRYFAKLICCFLAEVGGPRPVPIAQFAIGVSERNPVLLRITRDDNYETVLENLETDGFAQHGGLAILFDRDRQSITGFSSELSVGGIKYEFWCELTAFANDALQIQFPKFVKFAQSKIES